MRVAQVIRKELFDLKIKRFDGFFSRECQRDSVPSSLLALINMIQNGPNIKHQTQLASNASTTSALLLLLLVTRPLPMDGGMAEDHGAPEAGQLPRVWTRGHRETEGRQRVSGAKSP